MTEQEWLESDNPCRPLENVGRKASEREIFLFTLAACDRLDHLIAYEFDRQFLQLAENCVSRPELVLKLRALRPTPDYDAANKSPFYRSLERENIFFYTAWYSVQFLAIQENMIQR